MISGSSYRPQVQHGKAQTQIAAALSDPNTAIAKAVDGTANLITAALCELTNGEPGAVCRRDRHDGGVDRLPCRSRIPPPWRARVG
jgi:hypothetical protein